MLQQAAPRFDLSLIELLKCFPSHIDALADLEPKVARDQRLRTLQERG